MSYTQVINQLKAKVTGAIAQGVNNAADRALIDITSHVAVRTGRLSDSYAVTRRATTENLSAEVGSDVFYRGNQYPYVNRTRVKNPPPLLTDGGFREVALEEVVRALAEEFTGKSTD